jgi:hypothetical protein
MRGVLSFTLPEERDEFEQAQRAGNAEIVVNEIFKFLRTKSKYEGKESVKIEEMREFLVTQCEEWGVPL